MSARPKYLSPAVVPQPLIHRWYAWPHLLSPHTAAFNLRDRQLEILRSYVRAPQTHAKALAKPGMYGGPFLNPYGAPVEAVQQLLDRTVADAAPLLRFADEIDEARRMLREKASGRSLAPWYPRLGASLRGFVELVYDPGDRAHLRFFEPLLYRSALYDRSAQTVSLLPAPRLDQPFIFSSPVLPDPDRVDLATPFDSPDLDALHAARHDPADPWELAGRLGVREEDLTRFLELFTDEPPRPHQPVASGVRVRFFGHACVLIESESHSVLLDPLIGYERDGHDHFTADDLPPRIDALVLSHAHPDHVSVETLLRLRHRVGVAVVPQDSHGGLADPGLGPLLTALGYRDVRRLGELESADFGGGVSVTALPFLGEHADLDIRSKMVPLVRFGDRSFLFATDTTLLEPELFHRLGDAIPPVDALFIGLESVGAPLSWLYGPLLEQRPSREIDQERRVNGSDAAGAVEIARLVRARRIYAYAMGFEPWLRHLTGSAFDPDSEQMRQVNLLLGTCAEGGLPARLLYRRAELRFTADGVTEEE
ncbi:MAG TPA: MBL fold metallo-hydrolase [Actinocrinis sp.]|jgi:L-ascorbate metabolism protein UlaG (beta-lactamase superfamily)